MFVYNYDLVWVNCQTHEWTPLRYFAAIIYVSINIIFFATIFANKYLYFS